MNGFKVTDVNPGFSALTSGVIAVAVIGVAVRVVPVVVVVVVVVVVLVVMGCSANADE